MSKPDLAPPRQQWTHIDAYIGGLARKRTARRSRVSTARTQPESPSLMLSTLPFAALIAVLGMLTVVFAVAAWPASQLGARPAAAAEREVGKAEPGWFDEAKKEMR